MQDQPNNNSRESAPGFGRAADSFASMWDPLSTRATDLPPGPLASASTAEKLTRWDELAPVDFERLALDPESGPQLELLQRGEEWLLAGGKAPAYCPAPEALFEFAESPPTEELAGAARDEVAQHLETCGDCAGLVAGLRAAAPPVALLEGRPPSPQLRLVRGGAIATAALALVAFVPRFVPLPGATVHAAWPQTQTLRGPSTGPLIEPGGQLLAESVGAPWSKSLRFEVAPVERASRYTVALREHSGGAFDEGEHVLELTGAEPTLITDAPLDPGHYTWEAWATVDGLTTPLGSKDFELVDNPAVSAVAAKALSSQGVERVRVLHAAQLYGDARHAAESLPQSDERDAYLTRTR